MLADKFGQVSRAYPGKIRDEQELKDDAKTEVDYYASLDWAGKMAKKGRMMELSSSTAEESFVMYLPLSASCLSWCFGFFYQKMQTYSLVM